MDAYYSSSANLRTIDPHDKAANHNSLERAKRCLAEVQVIYILGFGFDANNCTRIGLTYDNARCEGSRKLIRFTNYHDMNIVNKNAAKAISGNRKKLLVEDGPWAGWDCFNFEKSERSVYDALAMDFDPIECD